MTYIKSIVSKSKYSKSVICIAGINIIVRAQPHIPNTKNTEAAKITHYEHKCLNFEGK